MTDQRSIAALDVAERRANGDATDEELAAAWDAAWAAQSAAFRQLVTTGTLPAVQQIAVQEVEA